MRHLVILIALSVAKGLVADDVEDLSAIFYDPQTRVFLRELSSETFLFSTLEQTALEQSEADKPHLTKECIQDLNILINGTQTAPIGMAGMREIDTKLIIPIMDSTAKIGSGILHGHFTFYGSFEQCKAINYFDQDFHRRIRGGYYRITMDLPLGNQSVEVNWDVCLPASCSRDDLRSVFSGGTKIGQYLIAVTDGHDKIPDYVFASYLIGSIMLLIILLCMVAGAIDYYQRNVASLGFKGEWYELLMCFSIYRNCCDIFSTEAANKPGQISTLNCIRTLSMLWVIIGHSFAFSLAIVDNPLDIFDLRKTYVGQIFANSYLAVDSFFFIAGVLVAFLKFKDIRRNATALSIRAWLMFYVHRIVRLSPAYYILILFYGFLFTSWLHDMPVLLGPQFAVDSCRENWWINFLYLNNFIDEANMCYLVSWYLATDFQIYIFSPLLILPFALFGTFVGIAVSVLILLISTGLNIFEVFYFFLPASDFEGGPVDPRMREKYAYSFWIYHMPYIRCQVFIVGLLVGYLLERKKTVRMGQSFNMAMWVAAFVSMGLALFGLKDWISGHQWDLFPRAMYSAFGRLFWTAGLSWIVIACHYGYGGTAEVS
ncbi:hypothetical protein Y032_0058g2906 [Ancylostoma ceylanicum]|uniref:Nose resistant-to-fluoxetine protein N-terminal domain-containing protein n=1 Tax=Ancylostoma ceylanicum TaxID=53326 RepID=A0A016U4T2_9BILA|nr:hypothetical protein Y032_0058g2906 [Ancylostoma ceylanicum]